LKRSAQVDLDCASCGQPAAERFGIQSPPGAVDRTHSRTSVGEALHAEEGAHEERSIVALVFALLYRR
jgi:hypothetical protein